MNKSQFFTSGLGEGKSGSFFFNTWDNKFIIKTTRRQEKDIILNMIDDLIFHFKIRTNNKSLLSRIYGVFTIKTNLFNDITVIMM